MCNTNNCPTGVATLKPELRARLDVAIGATRDFLADNLKGNQAEALIETAIKKLPKKLH